MNRDIWRMTTGLDNAALRGGVAGLVLPLLAMMRMATAARGNVTPSAETHLDRITIRREGHHYRLILTKGLDGAGTWAGVLEQATGQFGDHSFRSTVASDRSDGADTAPLTHSTCGCS
jgi:hypothetical protein